MKPTTVNRVLATLRHCASWIGRHRPFLAGHPCEGVQELTTDEPEWKGLTDIEVMRLKSAAEQLLRLKHRRNQQPARDLALFLVLLETGLRISELLALDRAQYSGKHFEDVKRKGRIRTRKVFLPKEAREALDRYLGETSENRTGPLFLSRGGRRLERQHVDRLLKQLAAQANARLPEEEKIRFSAHVLRHTFLRKVAQKYGVQFAMEAAGHTSTKYIFRYVKPSDAEKEKALEDLF
jgi:integrase/recombinase XerD